MQPDPLAQAAVDPIEKDMTVGLGTGKAATRAIHALAARANQSLFNGQCVATSEASATLAASLGLRIVAMEHVQTIDYLFDGADEVDPNLNMIKGLGGAMTREKIVARATNHRVYLVQQRKLVQQLGQHTPLPIEVLHFGLAYAKRALADLQLDAHVRADATGFVLTDQQHLILDARIPPNQDLMQLAQAIDSIPGVVGHGLFLSEADLVLVEPQEYAPDITHITRDNTPANA